jgi:RNA polymerase sigma-70 factor (ECF subfamily)
MSESDPEQLLADAAWLQQLALGLAGNAADADDLVQDARIAAWQRRPDASRSLRPWFAKVARDFAKMKRRGDRRRAAREEIAEHHPAEARTPDELLEHVRLHRLLVDLVVELAEPYRSTVIARYVEGRDASDIARSLGIPESTVRGRLREALARLRAGLDEKTGSRKAWAPAVLAFAQKGLGVANSTKSIAAIAIALLALLAGGAVLFHQLFRSEPDHAAADGIVPGFAAVGTETPAPSGAATPAWFGQREVAVRRIAGRVTFEDAAVAGAHVSLHSVLTDAGVAPVVARTGPDGRFDLGVHPAALYDVAASADERTSAIATVNLADSSRRPVPDQLELRLLTCATSVAGELVDANGNPIPRARISREGRAGVDADPRGRYRICVPPGLAALRYEADGYGAVVLSVDARGATRQDVVLVPEGVLEVSVVRAGSGEPVPDALVYVGPTAWGADHPAEVRALTDADGKARIGGLVPGSYDASAIAGGATLQRPQRVEIAVGQTPAIVLRLEAAARIRGKVLEHGVALAGAAVSAIRASPKGRSTTAYSQADGTFWLDSVPLGEVAFVAAPYRVVAPATFTIAEAKEHTVTLDVARLGTIGGRVTRAGVAVPNATVCCVRGVQGGGNELASDADGRYEFRGVVPGTYDLTASTSEAFAEPAKVTIEGAEHRTVDIALELAGTIAGTVVDREGKPVKHAFVRWLHDGSDDQGTCNTDEQGRFRCGAMRGGGRYQVAVFSTATMQTPFPTASGAPYPAVTLQDGASIVEHVRVAIAYERLTIAGRVIDDDGAPLADARITALPAASEGPPPRFHSWARLPTTYADDDGAFVLRDLVTGTYALQARGVAGGEAIVPSIAAGAQDIVLRLARPATVEGTLVGFPATPNVYARPLGRGQDLLPATITGATFRITGLAPGRYIVSAQTPGGGDARTITLRSNETMKLGLTSRGAGALEGRVLEFESGKPIAGAICRATISADGEQGVSHWDLATDPRSDASGHVRLDPVPAGNLAVVCMMPSPYWTPPSAQVALVAGQRTAVELYSVAMPTVPGSIGVEIDFRVIEPRIAGVRPGSAAARAGLSTGDWFVAVDGRSVERLNGIGVVGLIERRPVGSEVTVTVRRGAERRSLVVKVEPRRE